MVSLVASPCAFAENILKIIDRQPADGVKKRFGVCSKNVVYADRKFTIRFIEWIHMMNLLGAEKVHFYYQFLHPDLFNVVKYLEEQGLVEAWPYFDPTGVKMIRDYPFTAVTMKNMLTDCFYRGKNLYDYIAVLDMDEVIWPVNEDDMTWNDLIKRDNQLEYKDAYISSNVYYPETEAEPIEGIPSYMYMMQHIQRHEHASQNGAAAKSLFGTERVLAVHNHFPYFCIAPDNKCVNRNVPEDISQSSHYRSGKGDENEKLVVDNKIWKYKDQLTKAVQGTMKATRFRM